MNREEMIVKMLVDLGNMSKALVDNMGGVKEKENPLTSELIQMSMQAKTTKDTIDGEPICGMVHDDTEKVDTTVLGYPEGIVIYINYKGLKSKKDIITYRFEDIDEWGGILSHLLNKYLLQYLDVMHLYGPVKADYNCLHRKVVAYDLLDYDDDITFMFVTKRWIQEYARVGEFIELYSIEDYARRVDNLRNDVDLEITEIKHANGSTTLWVHAGNRPIHEKRCFEIEIFYKRNQVIVLGDWEDLRILHENDFEDKEY